MAVLQGRTGTGGGSAPLPPPQPVTLLHFGFIQIIQPQDTAPTARAAAAPQSAATVPAGASARAPGAEGEQVPRGVLLLSSVSRRGAASPPNTWRRNRGSQGRTRSSGSSVTPKAQLSSPICLNQFPPSCTGALLPMNPAPASHHSSEVFYSLHVFDSRRTVTSGN